MERDQKTTISHDNAGDGEGDAGGGAVDIAELRRTIAQLKNKVEDQQTRIEALARGREEGMTIISELRTELGLVADERDRLRTELTALESMQAETMAHDESGAGDQTETYQAALTSIDDLMATFGSAAPGVPVSHSTLPVESTDSDLTGEYQEMISPDMLVLGPGGRKAGARHDRYLVLLQADDPVRFPLDQDLMTIGRSDSADIPVDADFISRIHARILRIGLDSVIEDAGSKNGTWVNGEKIERHVLEHGDLVRIGSGNLRYVESEALQEGR